MRYIFICFFLLFISPIIAQTKNQQPFVLTITSYPYAVVQGMGEVNEVFHPIFYLGVSEDSMWVAPGFFNIFSGDSSLIEQTGNFRTPENGDVTIVRYPYDTLDVEYSPFGRDSMSFYICYPLVITNQSTDTLIIGADLRGEQNMNLILEGKDENDTWYQLETEYYHWGNPKGLIILPPGQIAVTSSFRYGGTYETDLRFRLGNSLSETFRGWTNPNAFH